VTLVFQLRDAFVEGVQFVFQFLYFVLDWKQPGGILIGSPFLWVRRSHASMQPSLSLYGHGPSESRARSHAILSYLSRSAARLAGQRGKKYEAVTYLLTPVVGVSAGFCVPPDLGMTVSGMVVEGIFGL
jgi:hypothetical protein